MQSTGEARAILKYRPDPSQPTIELGLAGSTPQTAEPSSNGAEHIGASNSRSTTATPAGSDELSHYVENQLPSALIYLPEMRLMDRNAITAKVREKLHGKGKESTVLPGGGTAHAPRPAGPASEASSAIADELKYAILSHRWADGEPTYQSMQACADPGFWSEPNLRQASAGVRKLHAFCRMARLHGCEWAWSDTCCINKADSVVLDEALRSMYRWYSEAEICLVYLSGTTDVDSLRGDGWFKRGWTLQELLAPRRIKFFNRDWKPLTACFNDKARADDPHGMPDSLLETLSDITRIPAATLLSFSPGTDMIKHKMSWAAGRQTTRVEDVAYSLIGIFGVSLLPAYGEGERAFYRLQLEIMRSSTATDLLLWRHKETMGDPEANSMVARSPLAFASLVDADVEDHARSIRSAIFPVPQGASSIDPWFIRSRKHVRARARLLEMTNVGLRMEAILYHVQVRSTSDVEMHGDPVHHVEGCMCTVPLLDYTFKFYQTPSVAIPGTAFVRDDPSFSSEPKYKLAIFGFDAPSFMIPALLMMMYSLVTLGFFYLICFPVLTVGMPISEEGKKHMTMLRAESRSMLHQYYHGPSYMAILLERRAEDDRFRRVCPDRIFQVKHPWFGWKRSRSVIIS